MSSYDQAASAKWANVWLFLIAANLICILGGLLNIERAIREAHITVCVENKEMLP